MALIILLSAHLWPTYDLCEDEDLSLVSKPSSAFVHDMRNSQAFLRHSGDGGYRSQQLHTCTKAHNADPEQKHDMLAYHPHTVRSIVLKLSKFEVLPLRSFRDHR